MQTTIATLISLNVPLFCAAIYANQFMRGKKLYTVFKLAESALIALIALLKPNKQFRLKPLVFLFYLLGDYIIIFKVVPAAFMFAFGHLLMIINKKYYRFSVKRIVTILAITAPVPLTLMRLGLIGNTLTFGMGFYILCVAVIFVQTMADATADKMLKFGTFMFYVSDSLLTVRQFAGHYFGVFGNFCLKVGVLLTYFVATNIYAIKL